jgi:hypothetical protein
LRLLYFASVQPEAGDLVRLRMVPMRARQMRLHHAPSENIEHLRRVLDRVSGRFGSRVELARDGMLDLQAGQP